MVSSVTVCGSLWQAAMAAARGWVGAGSASWVSPSPAWDGNKGPCTQGQNCSSVSKALLFILGNHQSEKMREGLGDGAGVLGVRALRKFEGMEGLCCIRLHVAGSTTCITFFTRPLCGATDANLVWGHLLLSRPASVQGLEAQRWHRGGPLAGLTAAQARHKLVAVAAAAAIEELHGWVRRGARVGRPRAAAQ